MCEFGSAPWGSPSFEPFAFPQARTTQTPELKIPRSIPPALDPHSHISGAVGFFPFPPTLPRRDQLLPCAPARPHTASHQRVLDTCPGVCPFHEPPGEQGWNRGSQHPQEQRIHPEPSVCSRNQELHFGMRICLQPSPSPCCAGAEQSAEQKGILAVEGGSIPSQREHELCGQQRQTGKGSESRDRILAAPCCSLRPWPCSDMPQFRFYCRNSSIYKNAAGEPQPHGKSWSQQSCLSISCPGPAPTPRQGPKTLEKGRGSPGMSGSISLSPFPSLSPCVHPSLRVTRVPSHQGILPAPSPCSSPRLGQLTSPAHIPSLPRR